MGQQVGHGLQKGARGRTVYHAVVERQAEYHRRAFGDLSAVQRRFFDDAAHAQNAGLRGVQNRRERVDSVHPEIGDGERAARDVFEREPAGARLFGERLGFAGDLLERFPVGVADDRHDQAFVQRHGHAHVNPAVESERAVFERRVHARMLPQGVCARLHDEIGIGDAELLAYGLAAVDQLADVHLAGDGQLRAALQALVHALGDHLAHAAQWLGFVRGRRGSCSGRGLSPAVDDLLDVFARNPAARAAAGHAVEIDAVFLGEFARGRGHRHPFGAFRGSGAFGGRRGLWLRGRGRGWGRLRARGVGVAGGNLGHALAGFGQHRDRQTHADHGFHGIQQLGDGAVRGRLDFVQHLFGFDLEQGFAGRDRVSLGLEPLLDRALGHGQTELGHDDFYCHGCILSFAAGINRSLPVGPKPAVP